MKCGVTKEIVYFMLAIVCSFTFSLCAFTLCPKQNMRALERDRATKIDASKQQICFIYIDYLVAICNASALKTN